MKIFVLEDDSNCRGIIRWLQDSTEGTTLVANLEDASYYLEYEKDYKNYDKFLMDASLPAATVVHFNGEQKDYNGLYNGIDYIVDSFKNLGIDMCKVAILTAYAPKVEKYLSSEYPNYSIKIINKNDGDLTKRLQEFLHA